MSLGEKPLYLAERNLDYQRHLHRLQTINNCRTKPRIDPRDPIEEMHRIRHRSALFHVQQETSRIQEQNDKLMNKLVEIGTHRKKSVTLSLGRELGRSPVEKRRQMEIQLNNFGLARRLLSMQSEFNPSKIMREVSEYQRVRETLRRNKQPILIPLRLSPNPERGSLNDISARGSHSSERKLQI